MYEYLCIYSLPHLLNIHALNVHTSAGVKAQLIHTPILGICHLIIRGRKHPFTPRAAPASPIKHLVRDV